jgi:ATP-dependent helicase/DNAse subunit B
MLITGPANAGKAREVLGAVRGHLARGEEPLLVVPTRADVERYRRELALEGAVLGVRVERFEGLIGEIVRRTGVSEPVLGRVARERVLAHVIAGGAAGAKARWSNPGFVNAFAATVAELEVRRVTPARLQAALKAWGSADGSGAVAGLEDLGRLYGEYRRLLERIGRTDPERRTARALDALRLQPALWGATPVLMYGFDDFGALQLDAIETLGVVVDARVTVSLTYEPGRTVFGSRAGTFETLRPLAAEHRRLEARAEYYAPCARAALHHLERSLFESGGAEHKQGAAGAVRLLEGGGERAELELVAGEVRALLDQGMRPEEIAIVHRTPSAVAELLGEVLAARGIPHALERRVPFANTAIGGALVGALRSTTDAGEIGDLLAWLRAPGLLAHPELVDRLEARVRREGVTSAARAREIWEAEHWRLQALDNLGEAARRGGRTLCERAARELEWLFNAPRRGRAALLESDELDEARALAAGRRALAELGGLTRGAPELGLDAAELARALEGLEIVSGTRAGEGRVAVVDPLALRARRVRALFLCGLQEGVFPASARSEPLLAEQERRRLAETSGLRLGGSRQAADTLAAERYALYAAVSRPQELLVLSWHAADDDGVAQARSLFVDDLVDLFEEGLVGQRARRPLGAVGWPGSGDVIRSRTTSGGGPGDESARARQLSSASVPVASPENSTSPPDDRVTQPRHPTPLGALRDEEIKEELREHVWSASSLEVWVECPVKWFVQRMLRADDLDPDPEPLARGALAHAVLKDTLERLRERTGSARLTGARLRLAKELLREALAKREAELPLSAAPERRPGLRRRLEADLERYLEHAAEQESPLEPTYLELGFGFGLAGEGAQEVDPALPAEPALPADAELSTDRGALAGSPAPVSPTPALPALDLGGGLRLRGRIDRVDLATARDGGGKAVVYDYKGRLAPPAAKWTEQGNVQVALYMRAVEQLLGLEAVGGFYQPLSGGDLRARGVLDGDSGVEIECVRGELRKHGEVRELLEEAVATARLAAAQAGRGELEPRPRTCAYRGGCMYPTICRCES